MSSWPWVDPIPPKTWTLPQAIREIPTDRGCTKCLLLYHQGQGQNHEAKIPFSQGSLDFLKLHVLNYNQELS